MTETVQHELEGADGAFRVVVLDDHHEQPNPACAVVFGEPVDGCPVRVHSRCLYGEIFEATTCDCLFQLRMSQKIIREHGSGVLIYLDQEGRGAGLLAKAKGYRLCQETGIDTFAAYAELEYKADSRSYQDAVALLKQLGLKEVSLLTNNPAKWEALAAAGIKVRQKPLIMPEPSDLARAYLAAKELQGHMFSLASRRKHWFLLKRKNSSSWLVKRSGRPGKSAVLGGEPRGAAPEVVVHPPDQQAEGGARVELRGHVGFDAGVERLEVGAQQVTDQPVQVTVDQGAARAAAECAVDALVAVGVGEEDLGRARRVCDGAG